jgi:hypothetical protein
VANHIDRLLLAFALDEQFSSAFLAEPLSAVEDFNRFSRRYGQSVIELNEEEEKLVTSIQANTVQDVCNFLALVLEDVVEEMPQLPSVRMVPGTGQQAPARISAA